MADGYDVVVVGGGHNGLACAGYLAKAGKRVLVLEARGVAGGGCATEEVAAPGFRHNFHSNFHGIIHMGPVYRDLELERYGARYVWPENQFAHVFPDGRAMVCSRSVERTAASIARFSRADAKTFRDLAQVYRDVLEQAFIPAMFSPPEAPSRELAPLEETTEGLTLLRQFLSSPNHVARDLFESPEVQTWLGFWVAQLAGTGDVFGLGANYPVMLAGSLEPYGWAICVGGSNVLAQAMVRFLEDHGGEVRVGAPVVRIEVEHGLARAVELGDGTRIPVPGILVSNLDPKHTFLELVGEEELVEDFARACRRWRYDELSMFCVYLALDAPVHWKAAKWDEGVDHCFAVSLCESLDVLDDNASDCRLGIPPRQPGLFTVHPSLFEPSLCPPGKAASFCEQIAPYELRDGGPGAWEEEKGAYADTVLERWRDYVVPGSLESARIVGRYVASPLDIELRMPSMKHGDWNHGEMTQDQLGVFRPFHEYPPYRTAFENVYLCGSSTHPGGSIGGACGHNAAGAIAQDLGLDAWWRRAEAAVG
jgi:phytoene dehydrogenase-like protein